MRKLFLTPSSWVHRLVIDFFAFQLLVYAPDFFQDVLVQIQKKEVSTMLDYILSWLIGVGIFALRNVLFSTYLLKK